MTFSRDIPEPGIEPSSLASPELAVHYLPVASPKKQFVYFFFFFLNVHWSLLLQDGRVEGHVLISS